ncbi:MAG: dipicolinate synthase subunit DpsA [Oscillospiraceae bacterium]|nr:dipicolinate synthase subunit DpsA [Oscillospiraceae bacterium]
MFETVSVIGGDLRQLTLARLLRSEGYHVFIYGFDKDIQLDGLHCETDTDYVLGADIIILPVPVTFDGVTINSPYAKNAMTVDELLENINPSAIVFGGQIQPNLQKALEENHIAYRDYLKREELSIKNAIPTAEGAIEIAISETPITIHGSKSLILGYGKIGKILAKDLFGLGAQTYVEARKYADLAMIEGHGYEPLALENLKEHIHEFDIIFNTVPSLILDDEILKRVQKDALIIDLASKPGGVDFEAAKSYGVKVIWALSLPGKIAPVSSGVIIKNTIMNIIKELGV